MKNWNGTVEWKGGSNGLIYRAVMDILVATDVWLEDWTAERISPCCKTGDIPHDTESCLTRIGRTRKGWSVRLEASSCLRPRESAGC